MPEALGLRKRRYQSVLSAALAAGFGVVLFALASPDYESVKFIVLVAVLAGLVQICVLVAAARREAARPPVLMFLRPVFYINLSVLVYFYAPLLFFAFNRDLMPWIVWDRVLTPLIVFSLSVLLMNLLLIGASRAERLKLSQVALVDIERRLATAIPVAAWIYAMSWITRLAVALVVPEVFEPWTRAEGLSQVWQRMPLLMPLFMTANMEMYFSAALVLCLGAETVRRFDRRYSAFLRAGLAADVLYSAWFGTKQGILQPVLAYLVARWVARGRLNKKMIVLLVAVGIILMPAYGLYRSVGFHLGEIRYQLEAEAERRQFSYLWLGIWESANRAEAFSTYFYAASGQVTGFLRGSSYLDIVTRLLPTHLLALPEVLIDKSLHERAAEAGLISYGELLPGAVPALWGELYLNFGYAGVVAGMPLLGMLCWLFWRRVLTSGSSSWFFAYAYVPLVFLVLPHGGAAMLVGGLLKMAVLLPLLGVIAAHRIGRRGRGPSRRWADG
jgi:hypothetical protein